MTQAELAKKAGVDPALICRLERGTRRTATYPSMVRIARALHVSAEELFPVPDGDHPEAA